MPSGMLCSVTESVSSVVLRQEARSPSGCLAFRCRCGSSTSSSTRNAMPSTNPPAAGIQPIPPAASASSIAGLSRLQIDAAIITPAAKPRQMRCARTLASLRKKNTNAEPSAAHQERKPRPQPLPTNSGCISFSLLVSIS